MAIARALWRPLVSSSSSSRNFPWWPITPVHRFVSGVAQPPRVKQQTSKPTFVKRFIPEDAKKFIRPSGKLSTTPQNRDFILEYDLEPDNGHMTRFTAGSELSRAASDFSASFAYSPKHVIHPYDLRFFEPRGHPLAPKKRAEYARKTQQEPLWIIITCFGGASAVVRTLTQRRLMRNVYQALQRLGYQSSSQDGAASNVRGTLWITIHDPIKAARQSPQRFGRIIADALSRHCSR